MAITRLQQARQMYAMGQRVAKTLDGSRPGYRGSDYGDQAAGRGAYSGNAASTGGDNSPAAGGTQGGTDNDRFNSSNTGGASTVDRSSNLQTYNNNIATGQEYKNPYGPVQYNPKETKLQNFYNTRPEVPKIPLGLGGMFMNMINPDGKGALQMFSDFSAKKNRSFFENVIRAGKIPGLDFGTVADMTPEQLENAYGSYMDNRMSGATDAYGNPIGDQGGGGIQTIPLQYAMSPDGSGEAEGIETVANDPFTSRYLQNQPENIRADIESRMQNYYTV